MEKGSESSSRKAGNFSWNARLTLALLMAVDVYLMVYGSTNCGIDWDIAYECFVGSCNGVVCGDPSVLRNKFESLKKQWALWLALTTHLGGHAYLNPNDGNIVAPESWWSARLQEDGRYRRFISNPFTLQEQQHLNNIFAILGYQPTICPRNVQSPDAFAEGSFLPLLQASDEGLHQLIHFNPADYMQQDSACLNRTSGMTDNVGDSMFFQEGRDNRNSRYAMRGPTTRGKRNRYKGKGKASDASHPYNFGCRDVVRETKRRYQEQVSMHRSMGHDFVNQLHSGIFSSGDTASSNGPFGYSRALMVLEEMVEKKHITSDSPLWLFAISWLREEDNRVSFLGLKTLVHRTKLLEFNYDRSFGF